MTELTHHDLVLRGLRVHCAEAGHGPPLLLVHGFLVSHKEWLPMLPHLVGHFRCILPDLPGAGTSDKPDPESGSYPYTREGFSETLAELLRELGVERTHVCAHSMGGGVALTLAADHPDRVERLTLMDSACYRFPMPAKGRLPLLPGVGPFVFKVLYRRPVMRDYFRHDVFSGHDVDLSRVDEYYADFSSPGGRAAAHAVLQRTVVDVDGLEAKIPRVNAPTLVLWGSDDRIFPLGLAHRLVRELPHARLEILEGLSHAPNEEDPARTAEHVLAHHLDS